MKKHSVGIIVVLGAGLVVSWAAGWFGRDQAISATPPSSAYADMQPGFVMTDRDLMGDTIAIDFDDDISPAALAALEQRLGVRFEPVSGQSVHDRIYRARVTQAVRAADLALLRTDPRVEAAEEEFVYRIPESDLARSMDAAPLPEPKQTESFPNDPRYAEQWHMRQIHMEEAWPAAQGEGVIVAVIDTGVARVRDLAQTEFVPGWNFVDDSDNAADDHGHGTHVAGTIAQSTHNGLGVTGVAYRARIMPIKVLSAQGSGSVAGIAQGIRFAADHGAKVINMSLGGGMTSQILAKAVKYAHDKGVTVVCAAGNDGRGKVSYPAAYPGSIAVAATERNEKTTFYSNWGKQIDIAAPGGNTRGEQIGGVLQNTLYGGRDDFFYFMGTSMASPHVAGVAALLVGSGVSEPDQVEKILKETARRPALDALPRDYSDRYGAGIVDAAAAVRRAQLGTGAQELATAVGLTALVWLALRRRGHLVRLGLGGALGVLVGASGLFFLPWLGITNIQQTPGLSILTRGLPAWDIALLGPAGHGNPLFYSVLIPLALIVVGYGWRRWRGVLAGLALGVAGHLWAHALPAPIDIRYVPWDGLWLAANAGLALWLGHLVARK